MIEREKLNDRQLALLKRVAQGDDLSGGESLRDRQSAYALSNRGLITVSKRGGVFRAQLADAGRARLQQAESSGSSPRRNPQPSPAISAVDNGKRKAPDATVATVKLCTEQAKELLAKLVGGTDFRVEMPTDQEVANWRRVADFAKRNGLVPPGKTLERHTSGRDLVICLVDGVHPNTKPVSPPPEAPIVHMYYGDSVRARDGAIRVEVDGHGFAVRISQVSPNSENPERSEALVIEVPSYRVQNRQTKWPDGKRRKVEDVLDLIIPELETQVAEAKQRKIDEERAKAERRANWERAMTRAKAAAATAYKAKILNRQVENWRRAATLRESGPTGSPSTQRPSIR